MVWLSDSEKNLKDIITHFDRIHDVTETDGQTSHDGIGRACIASSIATVWVRGLVGF